MADFKDPFNQELSTAVSHKYGSARECQREREREIRRERERERERCTEREREGERGGEIVNGFPSRKEGLLPANAPVRAPAAARAAGGPSRA